MSIKTHVHFSFISRSLSRVSHINCFHLQRDEYPTVFCILRELMLNGGFDLHWCCQFLYTYEQNPE